MQPSLFLSHGAPDLPLRPSPAREFLKGLGARLDPPTAILCISAHWGSRLPRIGSSPQPKTIHDFSGFPEQLYQITYPAPGDPQLAARVAERLRTSGFEAELDPNRGLDHGAWNPLSMIYPQAQIPVVQLSIQPQRDPEHHYRLGQALAPLRQENVLILASGSLTHNLSLFRRYRFEDPPPAWVSEFAQWLQQALEGERWEDLMHYRERAPYALENHPTDEHLLPLFVAWGAGGSAQQLHSSTTYGILNMGAYGFGETSWPPRPICATDWPLIEPSSPTNAPCSPICARV